MWLGKKDAEISVSGKRVLVPVGLNVKVKPSFPPAQLPNQEALQVSTAPMILIN
jgi:hypothetical protein